MSRVGSSVDHRNIPRFAIGSDQSPVMPLSPEGAFITNSNALTANSNGLVSAVEPAESANVAGEISASRAVWVVKRKPTTSIALFFSLGHTTDASAKTASIKVRGFRQRRGAKRGNVQYRGAFLLAATLTASGPDDTQSLLVPNPVPTKATSLKHVSDISVSPDATLNPPGARLVGNGVGGIAALVIDDISCPILEIEASVSGGTAELIVGEYTEF